MEKKTTDKGVDKGDKPSPSLSKRTKSLIGLGRRLSTLKPNPNPPPSTPEQPTTKDSGRKAEGDGRNRSESGPTSQKSRSDSVPSAHHTSVMEEPPKSFRMSGMLYMEINGKMKHRFIDTNGRHLTVFKGEGSKKSLQTIDLADVEEMALESSTNSKQYLFSIRVKSLGSIRFGASDAITRTKWYDNIRESVPQAKLELSQEILAENVKRQAEAQLRGKLCEEAFHYLKLESDRLKYKGPFKKYAATLLDSLATLNVTVGRVENDGFFGSKKIRDAVARVVDESNAAIGVFSSESFGVMVVPLIKELVGKCVSMLNNAKTSRTAMLQLCNIIQMDIDRIEKRVRQSAEEEDVLDDAVNIINDAMAFVSTVADDAFDFDDEEEEAERRLKDLLGESWLHENSKPDDAEARLKSLLSDGWLEAALSPEAEAELAKAEAELEGPAWGQTVVDEAEELSKRLDEVSSLVKRAKASTEASAEVSDKVQTIAGMVKGFVLKGHHYTTGTAAQFPERKESLHTLDKKVARFAAGTTTLIEALKSKPNTEEDSQVLVQRVHIAHKATHQALSRIVLHAKKEKNKDIKSKNVKPSEEKYQDWLDGKVATFKARRPNAKNKIVKSGSRIKKSGASKKKKAVAAGVASPESNIDSIFNDIMRDIDLESSLQAGTPVPANKDKAAPPRAEADKAAAKLQGELEDLRRQLEQQAAAAEEAKGKWEEEVLLLRTAVAEKEGLRAEVDALRGLLDDQAKAGTEITAKLRDEVASLHSELEALRAQQEAERAAEAESMRLREQLLEKYTQLQEQERERNENLQKRVDDVSVDSDSPATIIPRLLGVTKELLIEDSFHPDSARGEGDQNRDKAISNLRDMEERFVEMMARMKALEEENKHLGGALQTKTTEADQLWATSEMMKMLEGQAEATNIEELKATVDDAAAKLENYKCGIERESLSSETWDTMSSIVAETSQLFKAAVEAQREITEQSKGDSKKGRYHVDPQWSQGLVSAAKVTSMAVHRLVNSVEGGKNMDPIEVSASVIAATTVLNGATARLVSASRVKLDLDSDIARSLQQSAAHISSTAKALSEGIKATRPPATEEVKRPKRENFSKAPGLLYTNVLKREFDAQKEIAELELRLQQAQRRLFEIRQEAYQK